MNNGKEWPMVKLGDICDVAYGKALKKSDRVTGPIPVYGSNGVVDHHSEALFDGPTIVVGRKGSAGAVEWSDSSCWIIDTAFSIHTLSSDVHLRWLYWALKYLDLGKLQKHATIPGISKSDVLREVILLPPLTQQQRIAEILDYAQSLQAAGRKQLSLRPHLRESLFHEHFGDPATNPYEFPLVPLGELSKVFSDGPFGSNLKSSHYTPEGVRVIRLQNIGVGEFVDRDKAFVSEEHFQSIRKHECLPGDIVVGTLGDPNLRASLVPKEITPAINKADCVQIRVDDSEANVVWMCQLLNMPGTLRLARALVKGQTRARIAMGRLRKLEVPVPPLHLQEKFALQLEAVQRQEALAKKREEKLRTLTNCISTRAFAGQL